MATNLQDFSSLLAEGKLKRAGEGDAAATSPDFTPITFRRKALHEWHDGYYKAIMADGQQHFLQASTALDALEQAMNLGDVLKVERTSLNRARLIEAQNLAEIIDESAKKKGIAPGKTMLSFAEVMRLRQQQQADAAQEASAQPVAQVSVAQTLEEPLSALAASMDLSEPLLTPEQMAAVMNGEEDTSAEQEPAEAAGAAEEHAPKPAASPAATDDGSGLTPEEIERLLNGQ